MPLWILSNPLLSGVLALFVALGVYTTVLKVDNMRLTSRNGTLEQAEKRRIEMWAAAARDNAVKIATDKKRSKQIEVENARLQKTIDSLRADNQRLLDTSGVRDCAGSPPLPPDAPNTVQRIDGDPPIFSGTGPQLLVDLAFEADKVRAALMSCQQYVKGLP